MSIDELEAKEKEEYGEAVLEVVSRANMEHIEKWKEAEEMCATLEKIMAPELEEKKQEGIWEGRQEGKLEGMIIAYAELGISVQNIAEKLSLSVETVEKIVEENAH
jgi:DNA-binding NarL/FixJ family response regulator